MIGHPGPRSRADRGVAFTAVAPLLHVTGPGLLAGLVLTAGAGVLPDIDEPGSTIARSYGFLTEAFAWVVHNLSGGHRKGTHGGCPIVYPVSREEFHLLPRDLQFTTGKFTEHWIITPLLTAALVYLAYRDTGLGHLTHYLDGMLK